jgi:hypothetical protein
MAQTYTFRPKDSGAGAYVDKVAAQSGMDKSEIIRRSILLAQQVDLFDDAIAEGGARAPTDVDGGDVGGAESGRDAEQGGGVRADDLARMEAEQDRAGDDDTPQQADPGSSNSFWEGW